MMDFHTTNCVKFIIMRSVMAQNAHCTIARTLTKPLNTHRSRCPGGLNLMQALVCL